MDDLSILTKTPSSVLLRDTLENSLAFLIPYFVKTHLENNRTVILITVEHSREHYEKICRKIGCTFSSYLDSGRFIILDLLNLASSLDSNLSSQVSWETILKTLKAHLDSLNLPKEENIVVVLDSLSLLCALNETPQCVFSFCHYCFHLSLHCSFITTVHTDINSDHLNSLNPHFDFVCSPRSLDLLSIANVDGLIQVIRNRLGERSLPDEEVSLSWELFYRLKENGVVFFAYVEPEL